MRDDVFAPERSQFIIKCLGNNVCLKIFLYHNSKFQIIHRSHPFSSSKQLIMSEVQQYMLLVDNDKTADLAIAHQTAQGTICQVNMLT